MKNQNPLENVDFNKCWKTCGVCEKTYHDIDNNPPMCDDCRKYYCFVGWVEMEKSANGKSVFTAEFVCNRVALWFIIQQPQILENKTQYCFGFPREIISELSKDIDLLNDLFIKANLTPSDVIEKIELMRMGVISYPPQPWYAKLLTNGE